MLAYRPSTRTCSTRQTVQPSSQCKSHDARATTQPMNEAYGAQLRRSTSPTALNSYDRRCLRRSTQPIQERYDVPRPDADGWCGTKLTSTERIMVKKAVKRYCSNNLKNDYESEEINSQDSEHEDKKKQQPIFGVR